MKNLFCHLHCYTTQGREPPLPLLLMEQPANVHWFDVRVPITPTKSHPHKFNYCDLFFAMPSWSTRKIRKSKVHAKHDSVTVIVKTQGRHNCVSTLSLPLTSRDKMYQALPLLSRESLGMRLKEHMLNITRLSPTCVYFQLYHTAWEVKRSRHGVQIACILWRHL